MVNVCYVALDDKDILNLGEKLLNVAEVLDYAIPAFYRSNGGRDVFKNIRVTEQAFMNQCNEAVHAFGSILKKNGLFEEILDAKYFDVRANGPFKKNYGSFHSLGLIVTSKGCVAIDLVHSEVDNKDPRRTAVFYASGLDQLLRDLHSYYGGKWEVLYRFNPDIENYISVEDKSF